MCVAVPACWSVVADQKFIMELTVTAGMRQVLEQAGADKRLPEVCAQCVQ